MNDKEKKAFIARMKKGKKNAAKGKKKSKGGGKSATKVKYGKQTYSIFSSGRKQTKNLNVNSPPPESYKIVIGKTKAKKVYAEKKKLYRKVKMKKW